jgi:hypothetical protein
VRADYLETAIIQDIKSMYRDEQFIARVWEEANRSWKPGSAHWMPEGAA